MTNMVRRDIVMFTSADARTVVSRMKDATCRMLRNADSDASVVIDQRVVDPHVYQIGTGRNFISTRSGALLPEVVYLMGLTLISDRKFARRGTDLVEIINGQDFLIKTSYQHVK